MPVPGLLYEVGVGLWDFLPQAGLGILFHSQSFLDPAAFESLAGVWLTRALMLGGAVMLIRQSGQSGGAMRSLSVLVILGMVGAVTLSEQKALTLDEDLVGTWIIPLYGATVRNPVLSSQPPA